MHLKRVKSTIVAPVLLVLIAILYVFITYAPWLTSQCIAPLGADIKFHMATVRSFVEQVKEYGLVYPVEYSEDVSGFYWYTRGLLPLIAPALFTIFLPFNAAFFFFYLLLYILVTLALYFFVKTFTDEYVGFLVGLWFLFSNISNMIFSVGGNYQFLFGLLFFFLSMTFFYRYVHHPTRRTLIFLSLSVLGLGMTYLFSLFFLFSFMVLYALVTRQWNLFKIIGIFILVLGFFLVPSFLTGTQLTTKQQFYEPVQLLQRYIFPSTLVSWLYQPEIAYHGDLDFKQGIHVYLAGLLALAYLLYKRIRTGQSTFVFVSCGAMIVWVILGFVSRLFPSSFLQVFFGGVLPMERLMTHVALSFLFITAYVLHRLFLDWRSFVGVAFLGVLVLGTSVFSTKFFFAVVGIALLFGLKALITTKEKIHHHHLILCSVLVFLLLFPLTGKAETTNLDARVAFFSVDDVKNYLSEDDVFYFVGGWSLEQAILSCVKTHSIVQMDRDQPISGLSSDLNVFDTSERTKEILQQRGVTKLLIVVDQILENGKINENKVAHFAKWFGQPQVMQPRMHSDDKVQDYYSVLVFTIPRLQRDYDLTMESPRKITILNRENKETLLLNIEYHPWWSAWNGVTKEQVLIENDGGLIRLLDVGSVEKIHLRFGLQYFVLGLFLSVIGLLLLWKTLRKRHAMHEDASSSA